MAAQSHGVFAEKFSPYLIEKLAAARSSADGARTIEIIESQYLRDEREDHISASDVTRHYAAMLPEAPGAERIYKTTILVEPTTTCAAHCRWCLRAQYEPLQMTDAQIDQFARYCGAPDRARELREVLVTGGDPLLAPRKLDLLFRKLCEYAPNIETYRVGTRLPLQAPERIDGELLDVFSRFSDSIEIGLHVNHALELFPEVVDSLKRLRQSGVLIYNHSVLLRGLNDTFSELVDLCNALRSLSIENHYLFHCVPMIGMSHHRTSLARGLALARALANSGAISGRSRPVFALLTAVGKVVPYEGTIIRREGNRVLLQTDFRADERKLMNSTWTVPEAALVGEDSRLHVWYEDAPDNN